MRRALGGKGRERKADVSGPSADFKSSPPVTTEVAAGIDASIQRPERGIAVPAGAGRRIRGRRWRGEGDWLGFAPKTLLWAIDNERVAQLGNSLRLQTKRTEPIASANSVELS